MAPLKLKAILPGYDCPKKRQICYLLILLQCRPYNRYSLGLYVLRTQKIKHECRIVRAKSETIMGQVYPRVGLDCVGLGQKFSTFNESGWDDSNCKKCVKVYQYNFYCISALFASFFLGLVLLGLQPNDLHRCYFMLWLVKNSVDCKVFLFTTAFCYILSTV